MKKIKCLFLVPQNGLIPLYYYEIFKILKKNKYEVIVASTYLTPSKKTPLLLKFVEKILIITLPYRYRRQFKKEKLSININLYMYRDKFRSNFTDKSSADLKNMDFDFSFRACDLGILSKNSIDILKGKIISFHHGSMIGFRGGPSCFWEFFYEAKTVSACLQSITEILDGGQLLNEVDVKLSNLHWLIDRARIVSCSTFLFEQFIRSGDINEYISNNLPIKSKAIDCKKNLANLSRLNKTPTTGIILLSILKIFINLLMRSFDHFNLKKWNIEIIKSKNNEFISGLSGNIILKDAADPFWMTNTKIVCEYILPSDKGRIGTYDVLNHKKEYLDFNDGKDKIECHMSYPFVIKNNSSLYIVPEISELKKVGLFRKKPIDTTCVLERWIIHDRVCVDTTLARFTKTKWIMACGNQPSKLTPKGNGICLFSLDLFSEELNLNEIYIPQNFRSIFNSSKCSRPAGIINALNCETGFKFKLLVQDGSGGYASGLNFLFFNIDNTGSRVVDAWLEECTYGTFVQPSNIHHVNLSNDTQFLCIDYKE